MTVQSPLGILASSLLALLVVGFDGAWEGTLDRRGEGVTAKSRKVVEVIVTVLSFMVMIDQRQK